MPILFSLNENILQITDYESTPNDETLQRLEEIFNDPQFGPGIGILLDLTQYTGWKSVEELAHIASFIAAQSDKIGPRNAIVTFDTLQKSLAQIFQVHTQKWGIIFELFNDIDEARRWINTPT